MIGLFGGSFDPPHKGHLNIIQEFWRHFPSAHALYVIPNNLSPFKTEKATQSFHIAEMVRLLIEESKSKKTYFSDFEITKKEKSYSIDTLVHFKKIFPKEEFYFIIGADNLMRFHEWKAYQTILEMSGLLVFPRNEHPNVVPRDLEKWKEKIQFMNVGKLNISSTEIRENLKDYKTQLPLKVLEYIVLNNLYADRRTD